MEENRTEGLPNLEEVQEMLIGYQSDPNVRQLSQYFQKKSIMDIYGIARKEIPHSKFIAWLLNPNESHGLGSFALRRLLAIIARRGIQQGNKDKGFSSVKNDLLVAPVDTSDVSVKEELRVKGGRPDLFVKGILVGDKPVNIVIENKVESQEHSHQTETYYKAIEGSHSKDNNIYLFLTPKSSQVLDDLQEATCVCKTFIEIAYQDILTDILEHILKEDISTQTRVIIEDYIHNLTTPSNNSSNQNIMAMNDETQQLLTAFWESNGDLIRAAIQALARDGGNPQAEAVHKAMDAMDKNQRDNSDYRLNDDLELFKKTWLAFKIAEHIVRTREKDAEHIFQQIETACKACKPPIHFLSKKPCDSSGRKRANRLEVNGTEYYLNDQWRKDTADRLIEVIHGLDLGITIVRIEK